MPTSSILSTPRLLGIEIPYSTSSMRTSILLIENKNYNSDLGTMCSIIFYTFTFLISLTLYPFSFIKMFNEMLMSVCDVSCV